jgi:hypothetical protein
LQREAVEGPKRAAVFEAGLAETLQNQRDIISQTAQIMKNQMLLEDLTRKIALQDESQTQLALRVEVMERADRLGDRLSAVGDDIAVNLAAADYARRVNDNTRDEVRDLFKIVSNMMRQIQRLQTEVNDLRDKREQ